MTVICSTFHSTNKFTWIPRSKQFVTEISNFTGNHMGRVFDDACDEGFIMVSNAGTEVLYVCTHHEALDGEILGWNLMPFNRHSGRPVGPGDAGYGTSVYFFND